MRRTRFDDWPCPIARTADLVGDWWTPLVMREAFYGCRRFDEFQAALEAPRAVLAARLKRLVEEGMLERHRYLDRPPRYEYQLTAKGNDFWIVLAAMWRFGSDHLWEDGEEVPVVLRDCETGAVVTPAVVDEHTGEVVDGRRVRMSLRD
ncbi:MAG: helix-turn-helix transcriptional regulator [Ilumatobacteraceae bacterium]|nr:helix-turn-helix transcriptional regulator [Ilumatobacteraceae bacterium]